MSRAINTMRALVVDDEPDIRELIRITLLRMNVDCVEAETVTEAKEKLNQQDFALCLTDMRLPDGDGIDLVAYMQHHHSSTPVAVITAFGNMELAITALKAGAFDFVSKPVDLRVLRDLVETALKLSQSDTMEDKKNLPKLLGESKAIAELQKMIDKLARSQAPVLITGASGTGKELVARLIHSKGPRADKPFIPVNCGAIPSELMESEFFGYTKGSFTGAVGSKPGLFRAANHGTLFLDEIADLPLHMQVKLLRVIQEKAVRSIGEEKETPIDVRILSATHGDLSALTASGEFRQDLFYRINVIQLHVPKLVERQEDILLLAKHILQDLAEQLHLPKVALSAEAETALMSYGFPGNVRELENILERAVTLCEQDTIRAEDLQLNDQPVSSQSSEEALPLESYMDKVEKDMIQQALEKNHWNKTETAKQLGLSMRALRYRLKKLGLE